MKTNIDENWKAFLELCIKIKSPDMLRKFFDLFLTIEEKELLKSRFTIIKALLTQTSILKSRSAAS